MSAVLCSGWVCVSKWRREWNPRGPVTDLSELPRELDELLEDVGKKQVKIEELKVYCLAKGFDPEYYLSVQATPGLVEFLVNRRGLNEVPNNGKVARFFWSKMPPTWDESPRVKNTKCFSTPEYMNKYMEGEIWIILHDDQRERVFIRWVSIF